MARLGFQYVLKSSQQQHTLCFWGRPQQNYSYKEEKTTLYHLIYSESLLKGLTHKNTVNRSNKQNSIKLCTRSALPDKQQQKERKKEKGK